MRLSQVKEGIQLLSFIHSPLALRFFSTQFFHEKNILLVTHKRVKIKDASGTSGKKERGKQNALLVGMLKT